MPPVAGSVTDAGVGSGFPLELTATPPPVPAASTCVVPFCSSTIPVTLTSSPTAAPAQLALQNTKMPSDVSRSASAESSGDCMKKPLSASPVVKVAVTMPSAVTVLPAHGVAAPSPWITWIATAPVPSPHGLGGVQSFAAPGVSSPPTGSNAPISNVSSQRNA